jgi:hypothetical protein
MATLIRDQQLVFVHIPKTGGSSISKWLKDYTNCEYYRKHCTLDTAREYWPNCKTSFCVIRNPYDWLVSWYSYEQKYIRNRIEQVNRGEVKHHKINNNKDNLDILYDKLNVLNEGFEKYALTVNKEPQVNWAKNINIILRYENLNNDFKKIQLILNCNEPLEKLNTSIRTNFEDYYDKKLKKLIHKKYREDFKLYEKVFDTRL